MLWETLIEVPTMRAGVAFVVLGLVIVAGCNKKPKPASDDPVTMFDKNDPKMNAAMDKARGSVKSFIAALKAPKAGQSGFSVKMAFTDGDQTEHMWLSPVSYDGTKFSGTVNNTPEMVKNVKIGQTVTVSPEKISDWMYIENKKLVGGETLRVMRNALSPAERADMDKNMPFKIE
jgi:uncharacterized protein YegJ (DUF2314 family)